MIVSRATDDDIEAYTQGQCHVLAVALHRQLGWQIEVVRQENEIWWQDEADPDNYIPAVVHAYAVDGQGQAWDIRGVRAEDAIHEEIAALFGEREVSCDTCRGEGELATYVGSTLIENEEGDEEEVELPLDAYTDADVEEAWQMALKTLGGLPGFGVSLKKGRERRPGP